MRVALAWHWKSSPGRRAAAHEVVQELDGRVLSVGGRTLHLPNAGHGNRRLRIGRAPDGGVHRTVLRGLRRRQRRFGPSRPSTRSTPGAIQGKHFCRSRVRCAAPPTRSCNPCTRPSSCSTTTPGRGELSVRNDGLGQGQLFVFEGRPRLGRVQPHRGLPRAGLATRGRTPRLGGALHLGMVSARQERLSPRSSCRAGHLLHRQSQRSSREPNKRSLRTGSIPNR